MSRFEKCPQQQYLKRCCKSCDDFDNDHCDGCNMFTAYQMGRADAFKEALHKTPKLDDDTWKEDMERDAKQYEADRGPKEY